MTLTQAFQELSRRLPRGPALRRGAEALDREALSARIAARSETLSREPAAAPLSIDASNPFALVVDFLAARALGRTAVIHGEGVTPLLRQEREELLRDKVSPLSAETVFYSSGSVGRGKAIPLSDEQLLTAALAYPGRTGIASTDRVAVAVPLGQIFGFMRGILNSLLVGAEVLFFSPRRDPLGEAAAAGATFVLLSPAQARLSARVPGSPGLRGALSAGGSIADAAAERIEAERGVPVRLGYGMTESSGLGTRQHFGRPRRPGSSGLPARGLSIEIVTAGGSAAAPGETGEIRISGKAVFRGYADPNEAAPFDEQGRLRSRDLGFFDEEGELHVRGREASSISAHGRYLCAEELEGAALEKAGVAEAAAVPLGDAFGMLLVAEDSSEAFLREVREHLARRLPLFARPRRVRRVEAIPRSPSGKLDRLAAAKCFETS
jgi:long-chain acyl-CoA synthetase